MLLKPEQLAQHCQQPLKSLYVLCGGEPLSTSECLDQIRAAARLQGADERNSYQVDHLFKWAQISQNTQSFSLFSAKKLLEIHIASGKPGVEGAKALTALVNQPSEDCFIVITLPALTYETKNSAWVVTLQENAVWISLNEISPTQLPAWIATRLSRQSQTADAESLSFIANQVEGNLLAAHQEIQKLGLLHPAGVLSTQQIRDAVLNVSRFDAVQLGEAVLAGDVLRTARILQGLQDEGEQAIAVMNPLIWLFRPLLAVKLGVSRGDNMQNALKNARVFGDKQSLFQRALPRLSLRQLQAALNKLTEIDKTAKGMLQGDAWLEISRLCIGLAKVGQNVSKR
jgi:DNA polymerase III subunit delta